MDIEILKSINRAKKNRQAFVVVKDLNKGFSKLVSGVDEARQELRDPLAQVLATGKSQLASVADGEFFLDVYLPPTRLVVIGAVHITQHLALIAKTCGYGLEVIDPRTAFATSERFNGVTLTADWPENVLNDTPLDPFCALIALTHDPKIDDFALQQGLSARCFYVGALGSRKTHAKRIARLSKNGVESSMLEKIKAPIGLDIRAANPAEIAVAIMAQVIDAFRRRGAV